MRILIADRQPKVRFALRVALERRPGFQSIGEVSDAQDLIAQAQAVCPDLALIDWELPDLPLADLIRALHQHCRPMHVIILCGRSEMREQAMIAGADAFVCKCDSPDELLTAIDHCLKTDEPRAESDG
jgi:DNA-binding NarL/FixJ family response regulator